MPLYKASRLTTQGNLTSFFTFSMYLITGNSNTNIYTNIVQAFLCTDAHLLFIRCWRTMLRNILLNIYEFSYKQCSCLFCYAAVNFVIGVLPLIVFFFSSERNIFFREKLIHLKQTCIEDFSEKKVLKEVLRFVTIRTELIHGFTLHTSLKLFCTTLAMSLSKFLHA